MNGHADPSRDPSASPGPHADVVRASEPIPPEATPEPGRLADELVAHGLLAWLVSAGAGAHDNAARLRRVLDAIGRDEQRFQRPRQRTMAALARFGVGLAAAIGVAIVIIGFVASGERSAAAEVRASIAAMRSAVGVVRRYEVRLTLWGPGGSDDGPSRIGAVVDTDGERLVVRHWPPGRESGDASDAVFVGRDGLGDWAIDDGGRVVRGDVRDAWPPWSLDDRVLVVDSLDRVLEQLPTRFDLKREHPGALPGGAKGSAEFLVIDASRDDRHSPIPHSVTIWLDPATKVVERMEFRWHEASGPTDRPPMRSITFELAGASDLPPGWFDPATHARR